ncbi:MAG TPA: Asp-tRNA(Asn)/Glu-tRNA(Gln) amidotransferase subunit GatC [Polyangiaceae bacterium]|nr:Asp-tRNA(Asn)/Glu-tRNA(Gln) amidotransferase subunit GatC [Polyangiaceae bacterium]
MTGAACGGGGYGRPTLPPPEYEEDIAPDAEPPEGPARVPPDAGPLVPPDAGPLEGPAHVLGSPRLMPGQKIDRSVVLHVAKLAALSLSDSEVDRFSAELGRIVGYVEQLDGLDTRDVPPTAHVQLDRLPVRPDEPVPCLSRDEVLAQAPAVEGDGFAVPAFVE